MPETQTLVARFDFDQRIAQIMSGESPRARAPACAAPRRFGVVAVDEEFHQIIPLESDPAPILIDQHS